jgi:D-beta-D-heptose 7-phosphate kinase / D-beta-D-heptose 1-phosphate adenosyltransferase
MKRVLVVGDAMLDEYIHGDVERVSPEAPIPVLSIKQKIHRAGGAGNVALNISALGIKCEILTSIGSDTNGEILNQLLEKHGVKVHSITTERTITKTRFISGSQQLLRSDNDVQNAPIDIFSQIYSKFESLVSKQDFIIFSDYGKGFLSCIPELIHLCIRNGIETMVDPKGTDFTRYAGADYISPNLKELYNFVIPQVVAGNDEPSRVDALRSIGIKNVIVTKSEQGASLYHESKTLHAKATSVEVYDVTGAGDIFVATFVKSLLSGKTKSRSLRIGCELASNSVKFLGPHITTLEEYDHANDASCGTLDTPKVVFTNGCFDIVHLGHLRYLKHCKSLGEILIVAINSDSSVRKLKGPSRPINNQVSRKEFLEELPFIDQVIIFDEDTPLKLITSLKPHVLVKGGDYEVDEIVGASEVIQNGGKIVISPFVSGYSSTRIINRLDEK